MSDIFLSYKSDDRPRAKIIAEALEKHGYSVWWDRVIPIGKNYDDVIEEELGASKCVVVLWSKESVKSKWVKTEALEGDSRGILVPVLIEEVTLPLAFKRIEAAKLMDWDGTSDHEEFDLLLNSVAGILGRPQAENKKSPEKKKRLQKEEGGETFINSIGMKFTRIPAGEFLMGEKSGFFDILLYGKNIEPIHKVTVNKPFYFGIYPVTQREWKADMGNNPSHFKGDDLPVDSVSWNGVQDFIKRLNEKEETDKYRLPSEAEWEYAARAGTSTPYSFGDNKSELSDYAWYGDMVGGKTHNVGQKKPNPWGLFDIHGNVWEWVQDRWHRNYEGAPTDGSAWETGEESSLVLRGGSWSSDALFCRSAARLWRNSGAREKDVSFRLLRIL